MQHFEKWLLITKLMRTSTHADIANRQKLKFIGIGKILDGLNKLSKRNALKNLKTKLLQYLRSTARDKTLKSIILHKKHDITLLKRYLDRWRRKLDSTNLKNIKRRISVEKLTNQILKKNKLNLKDAFNKIVKKNQKMDVIEKIIVQERIIERDSLVKGIPREYLLGADTLDNAVLRLTYRYPLYAISDSCSTPFLSHQ